MDAMPETTIKCMASAYHFKYSIKYNKYQKSIISSEKNIEQFDFNVIQSITNTVRYKGKL